MVASGGNAGIRLLRWFTLAVLIAAALFAILLNWPSGGAAEDGQVEPEPTR